MYLDLYTILHRVLFMIWICIIMLVLSVLASRFFYVRGFNSGYAEGNIDTQEYWEKLKRIPIAGQKVDVPGFCEVIILGRGSINGVPHIDYIPSEVVNGRNIPDIEPGELERNTISCPLDEFIAQCEISLKLL